MLFGKKKSVAGLDIGSSSIKMVELDGKPGNLNLVSLGFENLPDQTIIDGQIMELNTVSGAIQNVCSNNGVNADHVVTGVSGHSVIIKNIGLDMGFFAGRLGHSYVMAISETRCGSSSENFQRTSMARSSTDCLLCVAHEYITEKVQ